VISLMIWCRRARWLSLRVLQYPRTENAIVTVDHRLTRRRSETVAWLHSPAARIRVSRTGERPSTYMTSDEPKSSTSRSPSTLRLNYDATRALTEIQTRSAR